MSEYSNISPKSPNTAPVAVKEVMPAQKQEQNEFNIEPLQKLSIQCKLAIGALDDPLEHEADAVADTIMRMPQQNFLQRKCEACDEEDLVQRKPMASFIQMKGSQGGLGVSESVSNKINSSRGKGNDLSVSTKSFMESRFGTDFSCVNIHTGGEAVQMNRELSAKAFTLGNDIYFNEGQYNPGSNEGKHLLAHELTHVVQQTEEGTYTNEISRFPNSYKVKDRIQRRISPNYSTIKDRLSRSFFDWAVTDADAHQALMLLKQLNPSDLRDTVAAMENDDLVGTFFDNLTREDMTTESEFLQLVQNNRTHSSTSQHGNTTTTVSSIFSCSLEQGNVMYRSMTTAQVWLDSAIARLGEFINAPAVPGMANIRDALQTHVHTLNPAHIRLLITRLQNFRTQMSSAGNLEVECAAPSDGLCREIAAAYVQHSTPKKMRFCPAFFSADETWRIEAMIHEAMHAFFSNTNGGTVTDRAYAHERVYEFLSPEEAFDNADSLAMLVQVLAQGRSVTSQQMGRPQDDISDCTNAQLQLLRPAIARAARWNLNSINVLADTRSDFRQGYSALRNQYFGSDNVENIPSILEAYQEAKSKFSDDLSIECETTGGACSSGTAGYYRSFIFKSGTLHVCPTFFTLSEENRIISFLSLAIMNSTGKSDVEANKYADFAKAVTDRYWGRAPSL